MKRLYPLVVILLISAVYLLLVGAVSHADTPQTDPSLPVIVHYKTEPAAALTIVEKHLGILGRAPLTRAGVTGLRVAAGTNISRFLAHLKVDRNVVYAEPNYLRHRTAITPNDTYYSQQYGPQIIDCPHAWPLSTGQGVIVAVIDSGVDASAPDLAGRVLPGINVAGAATDAQHDSSGHGTHVAGIIAAAMNNGQGIAGIAPACTILPIKVYPDNSEVASDMNIGIAIRDAADNGAQVINLSLGGPGSSITLSGAVQYAEGRGCVVVAAAGNDGSNEVFYPADAPGVIAVSASNSSDGLWSGSDYGSAIVCAAPGDNILSTLPGGSYQAWSGTSMAAPCVAGVIALMWSYDPAVTSAQIVAAIKASADKVGTFAYDAGGRNDHYGYGRINAYKALIALKPTAPTTSLIKFYPRTSWNQRMVGGKFQVSQDNVTYTDVAAVAGTPPAGVWTTVTASVDLSQYRYIRYISAANGYGNVAELQFYSAAGVLLTGTPFGPPGPGLKPGPLQHPDRAPANAFDGSLTDFNEYSDPAAEYVGIDRGANG